MATTITSVTIGLHEEIGELDVSLNVNSGKAVIRLDDTTSLVVRNPGVLHSLADELKRSAEEWDAMEANKGDITHADRIVDSIKNPDIS